MRFFAYVKTSVLLFVNMRSVLVFSFTIHSISTHAVYWIPMCKKTCKLEKNLDNFNHFRTQDIIAVMYAIWVAAKIKPEEKQTSGLNAT